MHSAKLSGDICSFIPLSRFTLAKKHQATSCKAIIGHGEENEKGEIVRLGVTSQVLLYWFLGSAQS